MATRQPFPRSSHAAVGIGSKLYVWGGYGHSIRAGTLSVFDVPSMNWELPQILHGSDMPDGIGGMAVTSATDDETSYAFGGQTGTSYPYTLHNTLFQITPSQHLCQELKPTSTSNTEPEKTAGSCIVQFENKLVLHGGDTGKRRTGSDELFVFDLTNRVWAVQPTTGEKPPPLCRHTFTKIDHHRAVVFGGWTGGRCLNDTYVLDVETWHWTKLQFKKDKPCARSYHATCCIAGPCTGQQHPLLMVTGGCAGIGGETFSDVWLLNVDEGMWSEVTLPVAITPRQSHSAVVFGSGANLRVVILFGGYSTKYLSDTLLLLLEPIASSWQVTRVVEPKELRKPDETLRRQMKKLQISLGEDEEPEDTDSAVTATDRTDSTNTGTIDPTELRYSDEQLGGGGQGLVWKGTWKRMEVAIKKCLRPDPVDVQILQQLDPHPNIITLHGFVVDMESKSCSIVMELVEGGSLFDFLHKQKKTPSDEQKLSWMKGIAEGMAFLHSRELAHRDLKSGNVLLTGDNLMTGKLCDFGTARKLDHTTAQTAVTGTYRWIAPEVLREPEAKISKKCDVFSYSMVLCEIVTQALPFKDAKTEQLALFALLNGERPTLPSSETDCPLYLRNLIVACWAKEPHDRPTFEEIKHILMKTQVPQDTTSTLID